MNYILLILCLVCCLAIIKTNGQKRLLVFLCAIVIFPFGLILSGKFGAHRLLIIAFTLSVLIHNRSRHCIATIPLKWILLVVFVSHLLTGIFDVRVGTVVGLVKALNAYMITFWLIVLGYVSCENTGERYDRRILRTFTSLSIMIGLYSIFCIAVGKDYYSQMIGDATDSMIDGRMRCAGFFFNSHVAGLATSIYLLVLLYLKYKYRFTWKQNMGAVLLFVALFLTMSRSSLLDFIAGAFVFYVCALKNTPHKWKMILGGGFVLLLLYMVVGDAILSKFSDAFEEDGGETGGSNVAMRLLQLDFSLYYFNLSPIFGNGFSYFWEYIKANQAYGFDMLLGAESYIFILLIERGAIQIVTICICFILLIRYFIKHKTVESYLGLALVTAFLVNAIVTGCADKWPFVMPLIGYYMRYVQLQKNEKSICSR